MSKYILTGGPCTGKTTLLNKFEKMGFDVVPECARNIIEQEQRLEKLDSMYKPSLPWTDFEGFQDKVYLEQVKSESLLKNSYNYAKKGIAFLDRGIVDNVGYMNLADVNVPDKFNNYAKSAGYSKAYFLEMIPGLYQKDSARTEDYEMAVKTHEAIRDAYLKSGIEVMFVPPVGIEERIKMILDDINKRNDDGFFGLSETVESRLYA